MKNIHSILWILILIAALVAGCGQGNGNNPYGVTGGGNSGYGVGVNLDEEENNPNPDTGSIVGTWRHDADTNEYVLITFNSDGTFIIGLFEDGSYIGGSDGTYRISGNTITITYPDSESITLSFSLNGNTLIIDGDTFYRVQ